MGDPVRLDLTGDQALVLLEYLYRVDEANGFDSTFEHQAEHNVLWIIEGQLEKQLLEVFTPAYRDLVIEARGRVSPRDEEDIAPDAVEP